MHTQQIILCSSQRSGSTMVVEDMRNTGCLGRPEEYFIPWRPNQENQNWNNRIATLIKTGTGSNGVFSVKIMANQLKRIDGCLAQTSIGAPKQAKDQTRDQTGVFPHFYQTFHQAKFIWLKRDDLLRQSISLLMSNQTHINHATAGADDPHFAGNLLKGYAPDYNKNTVYDKKWLTREALQLAHQNMIWSRFFDDWNVKPLVLRYEETASDFPGYLHKLADYCGLELPATLQTRKMVKLSNKRNTDWVKNYTNDLIDDLPE